MRSKKLLSIVCAFVMLFSASFVLFDNKTVSAEESVKYYYGTTLASVGEGSVSITSSLKEGLEVTFKRTSASSYAKYNYSLDMNDFAVSFKFKNANFKSTWFKFTDKDNASKWVKISFKKENEDLQYKIEDNYSNETEYVSTGLQISALTAEQPLTLSYNKTDKKFKLNNVDLVADGITTLSFYKNMANMSFGVVDVSSKDGEKDTIVVIDSIKNTNGTQTLVTDNSQFGNDKRVKPVVISKIDGEDDVVAAPVVKNVNAANNAEFIFPYYCIDVLGTGWAVTTKEGAQQESEKVDNKKKHALGDVNSTYAFKIYSLPTEETPLITLNVTAVKDNAKVSLDQTKMTEFINNSTELQEAFTVGHIVATPENNTFEFPHIYRDNFGAGKILNATDALDSFDNIKIQVGYKAPGDAGEFHYVSAYAVSLNVKGRWYFRYKITDPVGNETESEPFSLFVFDETAPTISISKEVEIVVNKKYTIPSATITDNASGVDTAYSKWTLYTMNADGTKGQKIENLKEGEDGYEDSILKNGVLTPSAVTNSDLKGSYILVYEARDLDGNVADPVEVTIKVVEGTPNYVNNPWNDFFRVSLIVLACLSGAGIIVLIFVKPKPREIK